MNNSEKTIGGISILGIIGFLVHILHNVFNIYEYTHKTPDTNIQMSIKNMQQLQLDIDSIRNNVDDIIIRDSLLQERARKEINKISSSN